MDENNNERQIDESIGLLLHVSSKTVSRIRKAFVEQGLDEKRPVICMDESSKQLIKETHTPIPAEPGKCSGQVKVDTLLKKNCCSNCIGVKVQT